MKLSLYLASLLFFFGCSGGSSGTEEEVSYDVTEKVFSEQLNINNPNPDRGFYYHAEKLTNASNENIFQEAKDNNYTLAYSAIDLSEYVTINLLPNALINTINDNLIDAEDLGIKLIFRIKYRNSMAGEDPSKEIIQSHLSQLKATLQNHKDIVSVVQAGTIGAWGEWHAFTGDYADTNPNYKENRRAIIEKLIEIFPDKYIQMRTPSHKELLYGGSVNYQDQASDAKITEDIAFTDDIKAKIAHHNDCFISSSTDVGTYPSDNIDFWKDYVINDSKYTPMGGETCQDVAEFSNCSNAISELKLFQWSYINESYHPQVLQRWKDNGCYEEIQENIGYRLVAEKLTLKQNDTQLLVNLDINNKGYAAPYVKSNIHFTLEDANNTYVLNEEDTDLRRFQPEEINQITSSLSLTNIPKGTYCLYLKIGESYSSIRLSNSNIWDEDQQRHELTCGIVL